MLNAALMFFLVLTNSVQIAFQKKYTKKVGKLFVPVFLMLSWLGQGFAFFAIGGFRFDYRLQYLPYSFFTATFMAAAVWFFITALSIGSFAVSSFIVSFSLLIPTAYGLLFLDEPFKITLVLGIALLFVSLYLINEKQSGESITISKRWVAYISLATVFNGLALLMLRLYATAFPKGENSSMMMVAALLIIVFCGVVSLLKGVKIKTIKNGSGIAILNGVFIGASNYAAILLNGRMPASVLSPTTSALGMVFNIIIAKLFFKENYTQKQLTGLILGIVSLIFLNI